MKLKVLLLGFAALTPFTGSYAASFDCDKASTPIEKSICTDDSLSEYDEIMNYAYKQLQMLDKANKKENKKQQLDWISSRNSKCMDGGVDCLLEVYATRISDLENTVVGLNSRTAGCDSVYQYQHAVAVDADDTAGEGNDVLVTNSLDKDHVSFSLGVQGSNGHSCTFRGIARRTAEGFNWSQYVPFGSSNAKSPECELDFKKIDDKQGVSLTAVRGNDATDPEYGNACRAFCGQRAGLPDDGSVFQVAKSDDCAAIRDGLLDSQEIPD